MPACLKEQVSAKREKNWSLFIKVLEFSNLSTVWALCGSIFYSIYIVLLRRKVNNEENMDGKTSFCILTLSYFLDDHTIIYSSNVLWLCWTLQRSTFVAWPNFLPFYGQRNIWNANYQAMGVSHHQWIHWYCALRAAMASWMFL